MDEKSFEVISADEAAARMGISGARIRQLLKDKRIPGAERTNPDSRYRGEWQITVPIGQAPQRRRAMNQAQKDAEEAADRGEKTTE